MSYFVLGGGTLSEAEGDNLAADESITSYSGTVGSPLLTRTGIISEMVCTQQPLMSRTISALQGSQTGIINVVTSMVTKSFLDKNYHFDTWELDTVNIIENQFLNEHYTKCLATFRFEFDNQPGEAIHVLRNILNVKPIDVIDITKTKRDEMRSRGADISECLLFVCYNDIQVETNVMENGLSINPSKRFSVIGDSQKGVVLCKHPDSLLKAAGYGRFIQDRCRLIIFRATCGTVKLVPPDGTGNRVTLNADCHMSLYRADPDHPLSTQGRCSQVFLFDADPKSDTGFAKRPRQCIPIVSIVFKKRDSTDPLSHEPWVFFYKIDKTSQLSSGVVDLTDDGPTDIELLANRQLAERLQRDLETFSEAVKLYRGPPTRSMPKTTVTVPTTILVQPAVLQRTMPTTSAILRQRLSATASSAVQVPAVLAKAAAVRSSAGRLMVSQSSVTQTNTRPTHVLYSRGKALQANIPTIRATQLSARNPRPGLVYLHFPPRTRQMQSVAAADIVASNAACSRNNLTISSSAPLTATGTFRQNVCQTSNARDITLNGGGVVVGSTGFKSSSSNSTATGSYIGTENALRFYPGNQIANMSGPAQFNYCAQTPVPTASVVFRQGGSGQARVSVSGTNNGQIACSGSVRFQNQRPTAQLQYKDGYFYIHSSSHTVVSTSPPIFSRDGSLPTVGTRRGLGNQYAFGNQPIHSVRSTEPRNAILQAIALQRPNVNSTRVQLVSVPFQNTMQPPRQYIPLSSNIVQSAFSLPVAPTQGSTETDDIPFRILHVRETQAPMYSAPDPFAHSSINATGVACPSLDNSGSVSHSDSPFNLLMDDYNENQGVTFDDSSMMSADAMMPQGVQPIVIAPDDGTEDDNNDVHLLPAAIKQEPRKRSRHGYHNTTVVIDEVPTVEDEEQLDMFDILVYSESNLDNVLASNSSGTSGHNKDAAVHPFLVVGEIITGGEILRQGTLQSDSVIASSGDNRYASEPRTEFLHADEDINTGTMRTGFATSEVSNVHPAFSQPMASDVGNPTLVTLALNSSIAANIWRGIISSTSSSITEGVAPTTIISSSTTVSSATSTSLNTTISPAANILSTATISATTYISEGATVSTDFSAARNMSCITALSPAINAIPSIHSCKNRESRRRGMLAGRPLTANNPAVLTAGPTVRAKTTNNAPVFRICEDGSIEIEMMPITQPMLSKESMPATIQFEKNVAEENRSKIVDVVRSSFRYFTIEELDLQMKDNNLATDSSNSGLEIISACSIAIAEVSSATQSVSAAEDPTPIDSAAMVTISDDEVVDDKADSISAVIINSEDDDVTGVEDNVMVVTAHEEIVGIPENSTDTLSDLAMTPTIKEAELAIDQLGIVKGDVNTYPARETYRINNQASIMEGSPLHNNAETHADNTEKNCEGQDSAIIIAEDANETTPNQGIITTCQDAQESSEDSSAKISLLTTESETSSNRPVLFQNEATVLENHLEKEILTGQNIEEMQSNLNEPEQTELLGEYHPLLEPVSPSSQPLPFEPGAVPANKPYYNSLSCTASNLFDGNLFDGPLNGCFAYESVFPASQHSDADSDSFVLPEQIGFHKIYPVQDHQHRATPNLSSTSTQADPGDNANIQSLEASVEGAVLSEKQHVNELCSKVSLCADIDLPISCADTAGPAVTFQSTTAILSVSSCEFVHIDSMDNITDAASSIGHQDSVLVDVEPVTRTISASKPDNAESFVSSNLISQEFIDDTIHTDHSIMTSAVSERGEDCYPPTSESLTALSVNEAVFSASKQSETNNDVLKSHAESNIINRVDDCQVSGPSITVHKSVQIKVAAAEDSSPNSERRQKSVGNVDVEKHVAVPVSEPPNCLSKPADKPAVLKSILKHSLPDKTVKKISFSDYMKRSRNASSNVTEIACTAPVNATTANECLTRNITIESNADELLHTSLTELNICHNLEKETGNRHQDAVSDVKAGRNQAQSSALETSEDEIVAVLENALTDFFQTETNEASSLKSDGLVPHVDEIYDMSTIESIVTEPHCIEVVKPGTTEDESDLLDFRVISDSATISKTLTPEFDIDIQNDCGELNDPQGPALIVEADLILSPQRNGIESQPTETVETHTRYIPVESYGGIEKPIDPRLLHCPKGSDIKLDDDNVEVAVGEILNLAAAFDKHYGHQTIADMPLVANVSQVIDSDDDSDNNDLQIVESENSDEESRPNVNVVNLSPGDNASSDIGKNELCPPWRHSSFPIAQDECNKLEDQVLTVCIEYDDPNCSGLKNDVEIMMEDDRTNDVGPSSEVDPCEVPLRHSVSAEFTLTSDINLNEHAGVKLHSKHHKNRSANASSSSRTLNSIRTNDPGDKQSSVGEDDDSKAEALEQAEKNVLHLINEFQNLSKLPFASFEDRCSLALNKTRELTNQVWTFCEIPDPLTVTMRGRYMLIAKEIEFEKQLAEINTDLKVLDTSDHLQGKIIRRDKEKQKFELLLQRDILYRQLYTQRRYHKSRHVYVLPKVLRFKREYDRFISIEGSLLFLCKPTLRLPICQKLYCLRIEIEDRERELRKRNTDLLDDDMLMLGCLYWMRRKIFQDICCSSEKSLSVLKHKLRRIHHRYRKMKQILDLDQNEIAFIDKQREKLDVLIRSCKHLKIALDGNQTVWQFSPT